jgi:hypothetical protein
MLYNNLIIRKSKTVPDLILSCNREKVYRVYFCGEELINDLDYNKVSDFFNQVEQERVHG